MAIPLSEVPHLDAGGALSLTKPTSIIQGVITLFIHQLPCYTAVNFSDSHSYVEFSAKSFNYNRA